MEEAQRIFDYLPIQPPDDEYIRFLWEAFESNYKNDKYQFAYIAYHMLFMSFIYYQIAKIYLNENNICRDLMTFTGKVQEHIDNHAPLQKFSLENERTIMGLFISIGCTREEIKSMKTIVDGRNSIAHSNGNIFFKTKESLEGKINEMLSCMEVIQVKSKKIIENSFHAFLIESQNPDEREFLDNGNQIKEIFVHGNYLSIEDVKIAKLWNITTLSGESNYQNIESLAATLKSVYVDEE
jgi:hypothetical protein